jgi:hypothetical protein
MSIPSTGRSKTEQPHKTTRARKVIRLARLPEFLGVKRSAIQDMIKRRLLNPFSPTGSRAQVVFEDEVAQLQENARAEAKAKRTQDAD